MELNGRVVLVTGVSSGIGEETARLLAGRGAKVVLGARNGEKIEALARELDGAGRPTDVTVDADVKALVALALERYGRLDAVFANAGFGGGGSLVDGDPEQWRAMLLTNVLGVALTVHYAAQALLEAEEGHVILTSSVAGRRVVPNYVYSATKYAVGALGEGLRAELAGRVRVTLVEPGKTDTPFFDERPEDALDAVDIARGVVWALEQPAHVSVNELLIRPTSQQM
ncbi:MAG: SDR family oxidoreductase [Gaiellaceae bacterium]